MLIPEENATLEAIRECGYDHGHNLASWQDLPDIGDTVPRDIDWIGIETVESRDDAAEFFSMLCRAADESCRQYSPFELVCQALNAREDSDEAWTAYDEGMQRGFEDNWTARAGDYYTEKETA